MTRTQPRNISCGYSSLVCIKIPQASVIFCTYSIIFFHLQKKVQVYQLLHLLTSLLRITAKSKIASLPTAQVVGMTRRCCVYIRRSRRCKTVIVLGCISDFKYNVCQTLRITALSSSTIYNLSIPRIWTR